MIRLYFLSLLVSSNCFLIGIKPSIVNLKVSMKLDNPSQILEQFSRGAIGNSWTIQELSQKVDNNKVDGVSLLVKDNVINGLVAIDNNYKDMVSSSNLHSVRTGVPELTNTVIEVLNKNHINYDIFYQGNSINVGSIFQFGLNIIILYLLISIIGTFIRNRGMGGGIMGQMNPMNNEIEVINVDKNITTKFNDIAGCDEAKYELEEIVDFLKDPDYYVKAGAKIPKGALLEGPPGTGKTLLARAVAGEAGVAFIPATGSEFIEMYVGLGAARVRKLFELARENKPCVIFIDEIDAIGRQRGSGITSGNDEREQTLNQILTNMDGFNKEEGIIVLGATNRVDILDSALVRSGRFDRKIKVGLPDVVGRKEILKVHLRNKKIAEDVDLEEIATLTGGFSGADLETLANEAVILALRNNKTIITREKFLDAFEKNTIGLPSNTETRNDELLELVAYHEAGHALIATLFSSFYDVRKVTITANNEGAGGYTLFTPKERYGSYPTKKFLLSRLLVSMGGRAAEIFLYNKKNIDINENYDDDKLFIGMSDLDITTGASNDLKQADNIARSLVQLFGYNNSLLVQDNSNQAFLGRSMELSEFAKQEIDLSVKELLDYANNMALNIVQNNEEAIDLIAKKLLRDITIDKEFLETLDISYP